MANFAIIGIAKLHTAGNIAGVIDHMTRQRPTANSNGRQNDILIKPPQLPEIMQEINSYLPRKNAVLAKIREISPEELPAPELLDRVSPRQYAADLINRVTAFIRKENGALRSALAAEREQRERTTRQMITDREIFHTLQENPEAYKQLQEALAAEAKARAGTQARYLGLIQAIGDYFRQNIPSNSVLRHPDKLGQLQHYPELQQAIRLSLATDMPQRRGMVRTR